MDNNVNKKLDYKFLAVFVTLALIIILSTSFTFAWFSDTDNNLETGVAPNLQVKGVQGDGTTLLDTAYLTITYNMQDPYVSPEVINKVIKVRSIPATNIDALVRVLITATWTDDEVVPLTYNATTSWMENAGSPIGYGYVYYDSIVPFNETTGTTIDFLSSVEIGHHPTRDGETFKLNVYIESVQGNQAGEDEWASSAPAGWNPVA